MDQNRHPSGVPTGGQFATMMRAEADIALGHAEGPDYSSWTPVEVDTDLARLHGEHARTMSLFASQRDFVSREIARRFLNRGFRGTCTREEFDETLAAIQQRAATAEAAGERPDVFDAEILRHWKTASGYRDQADAAQVAMEPLNDEFSRRGGWTRAFLVTNAGGHVHKDMDCSTCHQPRFDHQGNYKPGTSYYWVTDLSGHDEAEIVEKAGARACTCCYPSAPTDVLARPTQIFSDEERQQAKDRESREAAKIEREKARIAKALTPDGSEFEIHDGGYRERFKTEQAATTWAVGRLVDYRTWRKHQDAPEDTAAGIEAVITAISVKHERDIETVRADIEKKVLAKIKRDGYQG